MRIYNALGHQKLGDFTINPEGTIATIVPNAVTDVKLRDSAPLSVIGRSANSVGDPADIIAANAGDILRRYANSVAFGSTMEGNTTWDDNAEVRLGTGGDLRLFHNGANSIIENDTGSLVFMAGANPSAIMQSLGAWQFVEVPIVPDDSWTNAKLTNMVEATIKGRAAGAGTGDPTDLTGAQAAAIISPSLGANPTAQVGLAAVNGVATTFMRSDAAPPLDQGISPTWTGTHSFSNVAPTIRLIETDEPPDGQIWQVDSFGGQFRLTSRTDALAVIETPLLIARDGATTVRSSNSAAYSILGNANNSYTLLVDNDSNGSANACRISFTSGDANVAMFASGSGRTSALVTGGPTGAQGCLRNLGAYPLILGTANTARVKIESAGQFAIVDGLTAPTAQAGWAFIYVDAADGDLKVRFGDGVTRTIATD